MRSARHVVAVAAVVLAGGAVVPTPCDATGAATGWQKPVQIAKSLSGAVSCTDSSFCVAIGSGASYTFDGSSWSQGTPVMAWIPSEGLSCASPTFCMAVKDGPGYDRGNKYTTFDGTSWSQPARIPGARALTAVSCLSASFCAAGQMFDQQDQSGAKLFVYGPDGWGKATTVPDLFDIQAISCASATFCMAVDTRRSTVYNGTTWSKPKKVLGLGGQSYVRDVSCPEVGSCMAVNDAAKYAIFQDGKWRSYPHIERGSRHVDGVSCSSTDFCVAVDVDSHALIGGFDGFGSPERILPSEPLDHLAKVSCTSDSFCMTVSVTGYAAQYR